MDKKGIVFIFVAVLLICGTQTFSEAADKIYWTDRIAGKIQRANLNGGNVEDIVTKSDGLIEPYGIALDVAKGKIYWADRGSGKIQRANLNGGNVEDIVTGLDLPWGLALDVSGGKIYWTTAGKIQRANLNGGDVEDIVTGLNIPKGLALDVSGSKIYWATTGRIQRANLNGGDVENIVMGLGNVEGLVLDVSGGKIYWTDWSRRKVQWTNLDGGDVEDIVTGLNIPKGLALDVSGGKIYWTDWGQHKVQRTNLDGGDVEDIVTGLPHPIDIALGFGIPDSPRPDPDVQDPSVLSPDLIVERPRASKSTLSPGESFTLSAKIRNSGSGQADGTTLRYYRSSDSDISTSDTEVGTDSVSALSANRSGDESVTLNAPTTPGTYYYGACVDGVPNEGTTDNNCSTAVRVTVSAPTTQRPDLVVEPPRVNDSTLAPGERFTLSARVKNSGSGQADGTTLRYYRSSNSDISTSDTEVGTDSVSALSANRSGDESITLNAPTTPGTYYYGACVARVSNESDTDNNCSRAVEITVRVVDKPDLVVQSPWVSRSTLGRGESFQFGVTVKNIGRGQAPPTTLRYYRSDDNTISKGDTLVDTDDVGRLARTGKSDEEITLTAPTTPGTYYYGACVDTATTESNTRNNCSTGFEITVIAVDDHADTRDGATPLEVVGAVLRGPNRIEVGNDVDYFQLIVNGNGQLTVETTGGLDTRGALEDRSGTTLASSDDEGDGSNFRVQHRVTPGTYYLKVESYGNGTGEYTLKASLAASNLVPDLVVRAPSVSASTLSPGGSFTLSATVANVGTTASGTTTLRWYRSIDDSISTSDTEVGTDSVEGLGIPLGGRSTSTESTELTAPSTPGTYYYGACVDNVTNEKTTDNNCSTAVRITVRAAVVLKKSDLVVRAPSVSASTLSPGGSFALSATVANVGTAASDNATLRWYRSTDDTISTSDTLVGTTNVGGLNIPLRGGSTSTERLTRTAPTTPGTYYYGACVDNVTNERNTSNNCSPTVKVIVESVASTDAIVRVTPDSLTQGVGEPVTLKIDIADAQDVIGYNFTLVFDPSVLTYISSRNGNYLAGVEGAHIAVPEPQLSANSVTLGARNIQDYEASGAGTLALATFKVRRTGISTLRLSRAELTLKGGSTVVSPRLEHGQIIGNVSPPQQNIVRLIYFLPKDRSPQADIDEKIHDLIQGAQTFYAEQMAEKNGGIRKTFTFETDLAGKAMVHYVHGKLTNDEYYDNPWSTIKAEIRDGFDTSRNLFFIVAELGSKRVGDPDGACGSGGVNYISYDSKRQELAYAQGTAMIPSTGSCFNNSGTAYHELGHAFGLKHDFRDGSYVMSYGTLFQGLLEPLGLYKNELSSCAAEWLDASPFFNTDSPPVTNETTTIEMLPPAADSLGTLRFEITDGDRLHQVQLIAAPTGWKPPPGFPDFTKWSSLEEKNKMFLHACKRLDGVRDTFEFSRDTLSANEVMVQVIDKSGNITRQKFSLASKDDHGDTLAEANPVPLGEPNTGKITSGDDIDFYSIEAGGPGIVTAYTTGNLDTVGELQDSSGNVLKTGDDVGDDRNFKIRHRVTAGTYYIKVSSFQAATGSYTLHASFEPHEIEEGGSQFIYWSTGSLGKIQRMPADGTDPPEDLFTKADGLIEPGSVALDIAGGKIYWIDWKSEKIQRGNLDGSGTPEDLFTKADGLINPMYLTLDVANRRIYWTDSVANKIQRGNFDGFGAPEDLLTSIEDVQVPFGITLDLKNRHIYWTENRAAGFTIFSRKIRRATLDGFNAHNVVNLRLTWQAVDIKLNVDDGKIYWVDPTYHFIRSKRLSGYGDIETLPFAGRAEHVLAIELDAAADKIYWLSQEKTGGTRSMIWRMNLDGTDLENLYTGESFGIPAANLFAGLALGSSAASRDISWADVNRDGTVDIQDLVYIAQRYKQTGRNNADVNGDSVVNVDDFILVAAVVEGAAGAPAIRGQVLEAFTAEEIQQILAEARLSGNTSPAYLSGIAVLERLLVLLMAAEAIPEATSLLPNYPNPFNPETWIPYQLAKPADVTLTIYDIHGRVIRVLDFGHQQAGLYQTRARAAHWDGRNQVGEPVANGIYFYTLSAGDFWATRKMLIRK